MVSLVVGRVLDEIVKVIDLDVVVTDVVVIVVVFDVFEVALVCVFLDVIISVVTDVVCAVKLIPDVFISVVVVVEGGRLAKAVVSLFF